MALTRLNVVDKIILVLENFVWDSPASFASDDIFRGESAPLLQVLHVIGNLWHGSFLVAAGVLRYPWLNDTPSRTKRSTANDTTHRPLMLPEVVDFPEIMLLARSPRVDSYNLVRDIVQYGTPEMANLYYLLLWWSFG